MDQDGEGIMGTDSRLWELERVRFNGAMGTGRAVEVTAEIRPAVYQL